MLAKIEGRNPAYSVKCRIGAAMVWDAEKRGILKPGKELIEPTSGNTGIALAFVAAARGYPHHPDHARDHVASSGAKCSKRSAPIWCSPTARKAWPAPSRRPRRSWRPIPKRYVLLQQFKNPANPEIHFETTGPEIWDDTEGTIDVLVSGIGTGGTITGVSRYIKQEKGRRFCRWAWNRQHSPVITQTLAGQPMTPRPHKIQGIGAGFIPDTLDLSMVDRVELVTNEESIEMARRLAKEEGISRGISCGAAVAVAVRLGKLPEFAGRPSWSSCRMPASAI